MHDAIHREGVYGFLPTGRPSRIAVLVARIAALDARPQPFDRRNACEHAEAVFRVRVFRSIGAGHLEVRLGHTGVFSPGVLPAARIVFPLVAADGLLDAQRDVGNWPDRGQFIQLPFRFLNGAVQHVKDERGARIPRHVAHQRLEVFPEIVIEDLGAVDQPGHAAQRVGVTVRFRRAGGYQPCPDRIHLVDVGMPDVIAAALGGGTGRAQDRRVGDRSVFLIRIGAEMNPGVSRSADVFHAVHTGGRHQLHERIARGGFRIEAV